MDAPRNRSPAAALARCYEQFSGYACPTDLWVCPECGPQLSADDIRSTSLRSVSQTQLEAVHVTSLDDDGLRYFFPRLVEVLLLDQALTVELGLSKLKGRLPGWTSAERAAVQQLLAAISDEQLRKYPAALGYLSDCPSLLNFADWCDLSLRQVLEGLQASDTLAAARHLADLVAYALTTARPFAPTATATVLSWLGQAIIGERLEHGFLVADSEDAATQLAAAHQLWSICVPH